MSPTIFAIDTAGDCCHLALAHGDSVDVLRGEAGATHLEHVMPMIEGIFSRRGLAPGHCDAFAYASGPGSFTGLRVACTIVQGLALGTGRPVIAVGNLRALMHAAAAHGGLDPCRGIAAVDARMGQAYFAVYERSADGWIECAPPGLCAVGELTQMSERWRADFCAGDGAWLRSAIGASALAVREASVDGAALLAVAREKLRAGEVLPAHAALPSYVRDDVALTVAQRRARSGAPS